MAPPAPGRTAAGTPAPIRRVLLWGVSLLLFATGLAANGRAIAPSAGERAGGRPASAISRPDPAIVRVGLSVTPTTDAVRRCEPAAAADPDGDARAAVIALAHAARASRLSREANQATSADPACAELSASEYSLVWPSLQATDLVVTTAYRVWFDVSHQARGFALQPPILPFTPRPPPPLA